MFNSEYIESEEQIDFRKCGYLLNGIAIMIHRDYQIIYRNVMNYTTIVMKNKTKFGYKKTNNILNFNENTMNTISDSNNNLISNDSKKLNNTKIRKVKNLGEINSSNSLSFLIYSSNKDTNKYKKDALFGNLLSLSKERAKLKFNSLLGDSFKQVNSFHNLNKYLENNLRNNTNYFTEEKNKLKINESHLENISSIKNKNYETLIKKDYNHFFDNGFDFSLNDYLNSYKNDENFFDNNFSNKLIQDENNPNINNSSSDKNKQIIQNSPDIVNTFNENSLLNNNNKNVNSGLVSEEKQKEKYNAILNETLFNTRIKEKISKISDDMINNNNIIQETDEGNNKSKKFIQGRLRVDKQIDYYEFLRNELNKLDESKFLENIFSEYLSEIKFNYWKKDAFDNFKKSLNNCKLYDLLKLKDSNDSNNFDTFISNMDFSLNKNLSNSLYNSKSELRKEGSHSLNDSQSSQTIENQMEKNFPLISKFPKLVIPQSIIPEESSNFLNSNNEILNRSFGEPQDTNNNGLDELGEVDEYEEDNLYEENIKKELDSIEERCEINISHIFVNMKMNNVFNKEKKINSYDIIKEYKAKIFYDILLIAQGNEVNISQKNNFGKITKGIL